MPCQNYMDDQAARDYARKDLQQKNNVLQKRLDNVTRLLCGVMHQLQEGHTSLQGATEKVDGLNKWWTEHQRLDALREAQELAEKKRKEAKKRKEQLQRQLMESALAKLNDDERRALGL